MASFLIYGDWTRGANLFAVCSVAIVVDVVGFAIDLALHGNLWDSPSSVTLRVPASPQGEAFGSLPSPFTHRRPREAGRRQRRADPVDRCAGWLRFRFAESRDCFRERWIAEGETDEVFFIPQHTVKNQFSVILHFNGDQQDQNREAPARAILPCFLWF